MTATQISKKNRRFPAQTQADNLQTGFRNPVPPVIYPEELPVSLKRDEIAAALDANQVIIVCGETGSGKTTQLPKICLELGRGTKGLIGHTQPRRIAASATARRIASELGTPLGENVGYKIRFTDKLSRGASVKLMTDGILLAETQGDRLLKQYDTIIIDEAHERSLNIDFLLGYLKQLLPKRPDLKLIITSATIDAERFARHFGSAGNPAPIIEVSGRLYPVEIRYRPVYDPAFSPSDESGKNGQKTASRAETAREQRNLIEAIAEAVDEVVRIGSGDILIFLPGEREIRDTADVLRRRHPPHVEILPLFARLSAQEQEKIFRLTNARRIVLATNVAETSLTVPGIRFVIDPGLARIKRYSYRNKVEQLHIEPISQAAANQRAGRCGRVASGICIRLYEEQDFTLRPEYTTPEILRSSLASVILRMQALRLGDVETFPFLEPPLKRAIADGYQLLQELGALDELNQMTAVGQQLSRLPLDPRIGRMILAARDQQSLTEVLIIAAALSTQDPRERPLDAQEAADNAHQKFVEPRSEFMSYLKIWNWFNDAVKNKKSNKQLQETCRASFLSQLRLREWRDVHSQLLALVHEQGWRLNETPATYEQLHLALLTGLLGNIGCKADDGAYYLGARGIRFYLWPGSTLGKKAGRWVMAAELVETTRLYARCLSQIQPEWLERVGRHLLKKSWGEPRWEKRPAQVSAYERATLYGLVVYSQRRTHYGPVNPVESREIFIRDALAGGDFETRAPFFAHNQRLLREIENLEHKSRRADVLVDDELIAAFYDKHLPKDVYNGISFEKWHKDIAANTPKLLYLNKDDLMRHEAAGITTDFFPKQLKLAGTDMALSYHFEPGNVRDGVTLAVPLYALNQLSAERCEWLVPGMLKEKTHQLLKSLPQRLRRRCVPLPDYASRFCDRINETDRFGKGPLLDALIADIREQTGLTPKTEDFRLETLLPHLFMNFRVVDENGRMLEMARNIATLQAQFGGKARESFQQLAEDNPIRAIEPSKEKNGQGKTPSANAIPPENLPIHHEKLTSWNFGELPELLEISRGKQSLIGYPALVDKETHCEIEVFDEPAIAEQTHRAGLRRLFSLQLKDQMKFLAKNIPDLQKMGMQYLALGTQEELRDRILQAALDAAFMQAPLPANETGFATRIGEGKARIGLLVNEIARLASQILTEYAQLQRKLQGIKAHENALTDMRSQLATLLGKNFLTENDPARLAHFPRYLKAASVRIDKLRTDPARDTRLMADWQAVASPWQRTWRERQKSGGIIDPKMQDFRWMLEELRVSLFAQELRTPMPVSVKRLQKVWESMQR
ncbi:ATP-dependent RNA helicase HrpA [Oxalobacter vibrioformis]|uniref:ATP-dependent RNA helicase HrpA n=1 Tax=Oxalobacter vibrioformis TaxID=933080 RepID=A0A9E9LY64_9BURK|nr:ATP-dependent RNA helicase HrpA [Oxalobacter vibrioformis]